MARPKGACEALKELAQPSGFGDIVGHFAILGFNTGSGDSVLTLGGPGDNVVPEEHSIA